LKSSLVHPRARTSFLKTNIAENKAGVCMGGRVGGREGGV